MSRKKEPHKLLPRPKVRLPKQPWNGPRNGLARLRLIKRRILAHGLLETYQGEKQRRERSLADTPQDITAPTEIGCQMRRLPGGAEPHPRTPSGSRVSFGLKSKASRPRRLCACGLDLSLRLRPHSSARDIKPNTIREEEQPNALRPTKERAKPS